MKILATAISIILHPLLMITYGIGLALSTTYLAVLPLNIKIMIMVLVFTVTAVLPAVVIGLMIKYGMAGDYELERKEERRYPYMITMLCNTACIYFLVRWGMPGWMLSMLIASVVTLGLALIVNSFWKISAHLMGIGGVTGGVFGLSYLWGLNPFPLFIIVLLLSAAVASSRISLGRHTPLQTYAGFSLGFLLTFIGATWYLFV
ncbi:MAG TPA: hypothetical protein DCF91_12655 [Porphyromonadaceae bacterium]|nr:hypothetical protein [Porphyromonadaceae bacterium]